MSYLDEPERRDVATSFVLHELKKFKNASSEDVESAADEIERRTGWQWRTVFERAAGDARYRQDVIDRLGNRDLFWQLFHALSCGWMRKALWNCVAHPAFRWSRESVDPKCCAMDSPFQWLSQIRTDDQPVAVSAALDHAAELVASGVDEDLRKTLRDLADTSTAPRDTDPIIGRREKDNRILVHDGNRRLQLWILKVAFSETHNKTLDTWVGCEEKAVGEQDWEELQKAKAQFFVSKYPDCR
jgi:hypothetical protein